MAPFPRWNSLRASLAACSLAASLIAVCVQPAAARPAADPAAVAWDLYLHGKGLTARKNLIGLLKTGDLTTEARLATSQTLLDICIHSGADGCVTAQLGPYLELAKTPPAANEILRREQIRTAAYYLHAGQFAFVTLPGQVGELGVDRDGKQFAVTLFELVQLFVEGQDLRRADKGEVQRIEQQVDVFTLIAGEGQRCKAVVGHDGIGGEIRGLLGNQGAEAHGYVLLIVDLFVVVACS